jgi:beta-phosphoglucomutase-like phosphatase (HAD superfamily)
MTTENLPTTDLIIFDCDGVLIDSEIVVCRIASEELTRLGYPITTEQVIERFAGRPDGEMRAEIETDWGKPLPPDYKAHVDQLVEQAYHKELRAVKGVVELLDALEIPVCVASSSFPKNCGSGSKSPGSTTGLPRM